MAYSQSHTISSKHGNNALSYEARASHFGEAKITTPSIKKIHTPHDIMLGKEKRIEEVDEQGQIQTRSGLAYIYVLAGKTPTYIFDNHNHALYFRLKHTPAQNINVSLIHIDQHSDLNTPPVPFDIARRNDDMYLREYTNLSCQISNFIEPFLKTYPMTDFIRIKSEYQLLTDTLSISQQQYRILDIDIDFRAPEMSIEKLEKTISITRQLIQEADLVTIATSPLFIDQKYAIQLIQRLLS